MSTPAPIPPDDKDWTWVLERPCPDCGYDAARVGVASIPATIAGNTALWLDLLDELGEASRTRPAPEVWSPLEYACHVRDVHRVMGARVWLMLQHSDPEFGNWDQDATAIEEAYHLADPAVVRRELTQESEAVCATYEQIPESAWTRTGRRDNGSVFTVASLARYHLHDVVHHAWDVGR
ncbi:hypothetical protein J2S59_001484 [Nocardioides massiliensis]|uniref:DinB-like domain-containing protein n=2 Tax=Nocardioides massiliensis TaxID=1325935 RepID=A0ABT9NP91_9ACTN|nr:DinB family protein [Nocardioides massiliensis]MDP9821675.1 hypothetical protein [Nocardioides massiliensis]